MRDFNQNYVEPDSLREYLITAHIYWATFVVFLMLTINYNKRDKCMTNVLSYGKLHGVFKYVHLFTLQTANYIAYPSFDFAVRVLSQL